MALSSWSLMHAGNHLRPSGARLLRRHRVLGGLKAAVGFAAVLALLIGAPLPADAASLPAPVTLSVSHNNALTVTAYNVPPKSLSSGSDLNASVQGVEQSQCAPYGRQSSATAAATFADLGQSDTEAKFRVHTTAYAQGGHYRTFDFTGGVCIGLHGNDTRGTASSTVSTVAEVSFNPAYLHPRDYALNISAASDGVSPAIVVTDAAGKVIYQGAQIAHTMILHGSPGAVYFVKVDQAASSTNLGGCCSDAASRTATIDVRVEAAPILSAESLEGFIAGGQQTTAYKNVGAIVLDGQMHCSGTLIDAQTVLTAAHCLQGYESKIGKMVFILGSNYQSPEFLTPDAIGSVIYPKGRADDLGFNFNPQTYEDDIGLIHLKNPLIVPASLLFVGPPTWPDILSNKVSLDFVGFGYNVVAGDQVGLGIKREGAWQISVVENKRFGFAAAGKNTCHGDSGGPAFFEGSNALLLAGVTSIGDQACTVGYETRVDAYATWIAKHK